MSCDIASFSEDSLSRAVKLLASGEVVAIPTETVYGLAADATNASAVARIYSTKKRPSFNPLITHFADAQQAFRNCIANKIAEKLAAEFWPGAITIILTKSADSDVCNLVTAGLETLAVRVPDHPVARAVISAFGEPIAAPSANRSGRISPTAAHHVREELGEKIPLILDGGICKKGIESTILDLSSGQPILLRPGAITREQIEETLGGRVEILEVHSSVGAPSTGGSQEIGGSGITAPGQYFKHYAPSIPLRLNVTTDASARMGDEEALLAFGLPVPEGFVHCLNLSESGDLEQASANLFGYLRKLDAGSKTLGFKGIAVMPIPSIGLGYAINDRLKRAAS
jgi:L-threonylcarbamoyladenylate synthase